MSGGVFHRLYHGETDIQFVPRWKLWFAVSGGVIVLGMLSLFGRGLNLGIDFEGGVSWEVPAGHASEDDIRSVATAHGLNQPDVQTLGIGGKTILRLRAELPKDLNRDEMSQALAESTGSDVSDVSFNEVGPSWGNEISDKAVRALVIFLILVSAYIALRFEWKMALATLAALVHDILVTVGIYSVAAFEVTPATVVAILTILGYSIYDGIVVFDRVDENAKTLASSGVRTYSEMVNRSLNEVLMRTLNTSITALIPILTLLVVGSGLLGATTLREFALALFIGLASGAYSSIFIASPMLALLKERETRWRNLRTRLAGARPAPAMAGPSRAALVDEPDVEQPSRPARPASSPAIQARARKKGKRR
jgi:preprotein translocase subunit SecF